MRETGYRFLKLSISPEDLQVHILTRLDLMKHMMSTHGQIENWGETPVTCEDQFR
jgi:hypothetical protein